MRPGGGYIGGNSGPPPFQMMDQRRPGSGQAWYPPPGPGNQGMQQPHDNYNMQPQHQQGGPGPMRHPQQVQVRQNLAPYPAGGVPGPSPMRPVQVQMQSHPPPQQFHQQPAFNQHQQHQQPQQIIVRTMPSAPPTSMQPQQIINGPITMAGASAPPPMHSQSQPPMLQHHQQQPMPPPPQPQHHQQIQQQHHHQQHHPQQSSVVLMPASGSGALIDKARLDDLVKQIDPSTVLEDNVKDALVEYADEFVQEVIDKVCRLVQHRGNQRLEVRDVELVLDMVFKMPSVPRAAVHVFGNAPTVVPRLDKDPPTDAHKQRMMLIKKQLKKI